MFRKKRGGGPIGPSPKSAYDLSVTLPICLFQVESDQRSLTHSNLGTLK